MKNKSRLMNLLIMIFVVLIIVLVILVLFLFKKISGLEKENKEIKNVKTRVIKKEYDIESINSLKFDFKNSKVSYISYDKEKLLIKQTGKTNNFYVNKKKEKKEVSFNESSANLFSNTVYKVYIPKKYINDIQVSNGFGKIKIDSFDNNLIIDNNAGNVEIGKVKNININNVSGNIKIKGISNNISLISSTGDINVDELVGSCDLETITGDITIDKFKIDADSEIETTSGSINLKIDKNSSCKFKYRDSENYTITKKKCINGNNTLLLENVTGNIIIK